MRLEKRDRFEVHRLVAATADAWKLEMVSVPRLDFDVWLSRSASGAPR